MRHNHSLRSTCRSTCKDAVNRVCIYLFIQLRKGVLCIEIALYNVFHNKNLCIGKSLQSIQVCTIGNEYL